VRVPGSALGCSRHCSVISSAQHDDTPLLTTVSTVAAWYAPKKALGLACFARRWYAHPSALHNKIAPRPTKKMSILPHFYSAALSLIIGQAATEEPVEGTHSATLGGAPEKGTRPTSDSEQKGVGPSSAPLKSAAAGLLRVGASHLAALACSLPETFHPGLLEGCRLSGTRPFPSTPGCGLQSPIPANYLFI